MRTELFLLSISMLLVAGCHTSRPSGKQTACPQPNGVAQEPSTATIHQTVSAPPKGDTMIVDVIEAFVNVFAGRPSEPAALVEKPPVLTAR